jgi:PAS domain S-box-containing protein
MPRLHSILFRYGIALLTTVIALVVSVVFRPTIERVPFILFFAALAISASTGGFGPGMVTALLSIILVNYFLLPPFNAFSLGLSDAASLALFTLVAVIISLTYEGRKRAEEAALKDREWLRITLTSIGDAVITTDARGRITFMNRVAEALTGWQQAEALDKPLDEVFPIINEYSRQTVENPVTKVLREGHVIGLANHTLLIAKDSREIPIDDSGAPIKDVSGRVRGTVLIFRDVTEQRQAQRIQAQLAAIVEGSDDAIISKDLNAVITSWNKGAERMYGYAAEEMVGQPIARLIPPDIPNDVQSILERIKRGERVEHYETKRQRKDGVTLDVSLTISPVHDAEGRVSGASKIARDVTERKRIETQLREQAEIIETLNRVGQAVSAELDVERLVQLVTDAATELAGAEFGAFFYNVIDDQGEAYMLYSLSGAPRDAFAQFPMPRNTAIFRPTFRGEAAVRLEDVTKDPRYGTNPPYAGMPSGHLPVVSYLAVPVVSRSKKVLGGVFLGHTKPGMFTERAEQLVVGLAAQTAIAIDNAHLYQQTREERERLQVTLASIGDAVITTDARGRVNFMNGVAEALTGWQQAEALDKPLDEVFAIINEYSRQTVENPVTKVIREGVIVGLANHTILMSRTGREIPIDDSGAPIRNEAGHIVGVVLVFRDITEQRSVQRLQAQLAAIVEGSDDAIIGKDLQGIITSWNQGAVRIYGYTAEEMVGQPIARLIPPTIPNDVPPILERIQRGERVEHYETKRMCKDGTVLDVSLTVSPIRDSEGTVMGASKIARDITEQKHREAERVRLLEREQHARAEAEAAVRTRDEFLSVAAHELKTPMTSLRGFAQLNLRRISKTDTVALDDVKRAFQLIDDQAVKLTRLVNQLLDISRIQAGRLELERQPTNVTDLVQAVSSQAQVNTSRHTLLVHAPGPITASIDALRLEQVISNMVDNAIKYSPEGGSIDIDLSQPDDTALRITVTDRGIGIPPEHRTHIFRRFYQAHSGQHLSGLGLGLHISKQIVELHGGTLEAEFPEEGGTRFIVSLPTNIQA